MTAQLQLFMILGAVVLLLIILYRREGIMGMRCCSSSLRF